MSVENPYFKTCPTCKGKKNVGSDQNQALMGAQAFIDCPECERRGVVLTEQGKHLIDFLEYRQMNIWTKN